MCGIGCWGDVARSDAIPSAIVGIMLLQQYTEVNLVLGGSAAIIAKLSKEQNIETLDFGIDMIFVR
jgi:antitoxin component of MazEF toxin-antitoxin module